MKTCEYSGDVLDEPRSHPWTDAVADSACRYYDFRAEPSLIRTSLEDFIPWSHYPAVSRLYELLEWLNDSSSIFESNDCAFSAPQPSEAPQLGALQCDGRLMILYRELEVNLSRQRIESLKNDLHGRLAVLDQDFGMGMIGTSIPPVRYMALPVAPEGQRGHQLMISFWAWGNSEDEVMNNLERVLRNLGDAIMLLS